MSGWEEGRSRRALPGILVLSAGKRTEIGASPTGSAPALRSPRETKKAGTLIEKIIFPINNPPLRVLY